MEDYFRLLDVSLAEARMLRYEAATKECNGEISKWNASGNLGNGRLPLHLCAIYTENLRALAKEYALAALEIYQSFDFEIDESVRGRIISFCLAELNVSKRSFEETLYGFAPFNTQGINRGGTADRARGLCAIELQAQLATCEATMSNDLEIKLRRVNVDKNKAAAVTINVAGNVQNMQVGDYNKMNVTQDNRVAFSNAFNQIREGLKNTLPEQEYVQLNEVMTECEGEFKKDNPNITKIKGLLAGVGSVVRGLPQVADGYEALKTLSSLFGVNLP